jgi:CLIP-associating protein 1/2
MALDLGTAGKVLSEEEVEDFLTKLNKAGESLYRIETKLTEPDLDKKVDIVQFFGLKLEDAAGVGVNVGYADPNQLPTTTMDALSLTLAPLLKSTSHLLISATLTSFIPFYLPLLPLEPHHHLQLALKQSLAPLLEKLNDPKERTNTLAANSIAILGRKCYEAESVSPTTSGGKGKEKESLATIWERGIKDTLAGKGWRGKVGAMKMLFILRAEKQSRLPLKPWIGALVDLLEDSDGNVRDQAKEVGSSTSRTNDRPLSPSFLPHPPHPLHDPS